MRRGVRRAADMGFYDDDEGNLVDLGWVGFDRED